jgi:hypothetical protein
MAVKIEGEYWVLLKWWEAFYTLPDSHSLEFMSAGPEKIVQFNCWTISLREPLPADRVLSLFPENIP